MGREVALAYHPREAFIPFHQRSERWASMVCHRRAGKTVACIGELVTRALYTTKHRPEYAYIGPYRSQAKKIAWAYLLDFTEGLRSGPPRVSDLSVTLHTGATITLYGADNPDALRGIYLDGVILDEYGDCRPALWGEVVLPTLLDRKGWAVFIGTPKGKNHFWKVVQRAEKEAGWYSFILKASESGLLDEEALREARAEMSDDQYEQELECNFEAAVQGAYYSALIARMELDSFDGPARIGNYPYDPNLQVHAAADLGYTDSTAFWFWQLTESGPRIIDYHEANGEEMPYYFDMLAEKGYDYADVWLPHDAKATSFQTGRTTIEQFLEAGYPCKITPKQKVQHGIDAARMIMHQITINKATCEQGIETLRAYRRAWNDKTQQFSDAPLHDWASNGADAFRYFALVTETDAATLQVEEEAQPILAPVEFRLNDFPIQEDDDWAIIRL
jgi:phage terminase large subunit